MLIELLMFNKIYKTSEVMLTTLTIIQSEENRLKINWPIANTCNAIHV